MRRRHPLLHDAQRGGRLCTVTTGCEGRGKTSGRTGSPVLLFLSILKPRTAQVPPELPSGGRKRRSAQDMIFYFFAVRTHIQQ